MRKPRYTITQNLRHGDIVTIIKGNKVIRCGGKRKIMGVFQLEDTKAYILPNGNIERINTPRGIQIYGMSNVLTK